MPKSIQYHPPVKHYKELFNDADRSSNIGSTMVDSKFSADISTESCFKIPWQFKISDKSLRIKKRTDAINSVDALKKRIWLINHQHLLNNANQHKEHVIDINSNR